MQRKYEFRIPEPKGLGAKVPKGAPVERNLSKAKVNDANQLAPTTDAPVRAHYRMAGGR